MSNFHQLMNIDEGDLLSNRSKLDKYNDYIEEIVGSNDPLFFESIKNITAITYFSSLFETRQPSDSYIKECLNTVYINIVSSFYDMASIIEGYLNYAQQHNVSYPITLTNEGELLIKLSDIMLISDYYFTIGINVKDGYISFIRDAGIAETERRNSTIGYTYINNDMILSHFDYVNILQRHNNSIKYDVLGFSMEHLLNNYNTITIGIIFLIKNYLEQLNINDERCSVIDNIILLKLVR